MFSVESVFKAIDRVTAPVSRMQRNVLRFTRGMERGLRRVDRVLNSVGGGLLKAGKATLKYGGIALGGLTAAVGLLVREFSKVEDAQAAFTPLLGGAERARQAVEAINQTAATTPFQFETLASAVNQLLPVMNGNIENTIKTVRMLGDTAGGNAQKLDSITRGFTKAMLKGKVDMESLNMIAEAGVPIFQDLADVMGMKTGPKFFRMISAGRVTTAQLTKAFEKLTGQGGKFYQGMEIASQTTSGLWSTLKDNISLTAAELGAVLAPTVKELIRQATVAAQQIREWVKSNRELIATRFEEFVLRAKDVLGGLIDQIRNLNSQHSLLDRLMQIVIGVSDAFSYMREHGAAIGKVVAAVVALSLAAKTLIGVLTLVNLVMAANPITLIVLGVLAAVAAFSALVVWIDDVVAGFEKLPGVIKLVLAPLRALLHGIKFIKDAFKGGFGFAAEQFRASFGTEESPPAARSGTRQVAGPQERAARIVEEIRSASTAEVTIKDETGRAEVTKGRLGYGV